MRSPIMFTFRHAQGSARRLRVHYRSGHGRMADRHVESPHPHGRRAKAALSSPGCGVGGGAPRPEGVQRTSETLTGCTLVEGYGLSETGPVCTVSPLHGVKKAGSAGLPMPGTVIEIVALDDPDRLLGPGEHGEICITGPQVMHGYSNRAQETMDAMRGGRLHTGEVGYLDED